MSPTAPQPASDPAESLVRILEGLCEAIAARCEKEQPASPIKRLAWAQFRRLAAWFAALMADVRAGLHAAAPVAHRRAAHDPAAAFLPAPSPYCLLPGFGWLLRFVPGTAPFGAQVRLWLCGPKIRGCTAGVVAAIPSPPSPALPDAGHLGGRGLRSPRHGSSARLAATPVIPAPSLSPSARSRAPSCCVARFGPQDAGCACQPPCFRRPDGPIAAWAEALPDPPPNFLRRLERGRESTSLSFRYRNTQPVVRSEPYSCL